MYTYIGEGEKYLTSRTLYRLTKNNRDQGLGAGLKLSTKTLLILSINDSLQWKSMDQKVVLDRVK